MLLLRNLSRRWLFFLGKIILQALSYHWLLLWLWGFILVLFHLFLISFFVRIVNAEFGIEKAHFVLHKLKMLRHQTQITLELAKQPLNFALLNLYQEGFGSSDVLC